MPTTALTYTVLQPLCYHSFLHVDLSSMWHAHALSCQCLLLLHRIVVCNVAVSSTVLYAMLPCVFCLLMLYHILKASSSLSELQRNEVLPDVVNQCRDLRQKACKPIRLMLILILVSVCVIHLFV
jgi:carbon starvation protein CstA